MQNSEEISYSEIMKVSRILETQDVIFHQFWELGKPSFTEKVPTACVEFNKQGECINFLFNPKFWSNLNDHQRAFIIAHECLHVFLNHGVRSMEEKDKMLANVALDVAVNHSLVNNFGFDYEKLESLKDSLCFVNTIFKGENISDEENFEFYMSELKKDPSKAKDFTSIDSHEFISNEQIKKILENATKNNKISPESLKEFLNKNNKDSKKEIGDTEWIDEIICKKKKVQARKKWLQVVNRLIKNHCSLTYQERWGMYDHRRNSISGLIPSEKILLDNDKQKINILMFLDSSGSCYELAPLFFRASDSIPRDTFNVSLYSFDTSVHHINKDRKIKGGGGTYFRCINEYIEKNNLKYDLIFIITDGYGGKFSCKKPDKWVWFLSTGYKSDIPSNSKIHFLKDFYSE